MVAAGEEGLDELSIAGPSLVETLGLADIPGSVSPEDAGLPRHSLEAIRGGDAQFNAAAIARLLDGERGPYRDAVLLNAAGALIVAGEAASWEEGVEEAAEAIDKGLAKALLACWIDAVR
jgi:anthranilate phosphoribosyltransferase